MIDLYLMRHAQAAGVGGAIQRDQDRPLTAHGEAQADAIGRELTRRGVAVQAVITSPYRRADETARRVAEFLGTPRVERSTLLSSRGTPPRLKPLLELARPAGSLLLVGHAPDIGLLAEAISDRSIPFSTATLGAFRWDPSADRAEFLWALHPEDLLHQ